MSSIHHRRPTAPLESASSDDWPEGRGASADTDAEAARGTHRGWGVVAVLAGVCLVLRLIRLTALPIFGDEAIYLRWTQLIRLDPLRNAFISLIDPKPPLHYWLMAAFWNASDDPLWSGRLVSVLAGVGTVFALAGVCREIHRVLLARDDISRPAMGILVPIVLLLAMFCPYLAFYQRMALAESLFVLEMCAIVWISLRWVRAIQQEASAGVIVLTTVALGGAFGLCFLTRQNMSYVLVGVVPLAWMLAAKRGASDGWGSPWTRRAGMGIVLFGMALLLAVILWSPFLVERPDLSAKSTWGAELKRRILYQDQFTQPMTLGERVGLVASNVRTAFVPWDATGHRFALDQGWFWVNLTPPIFVLVLAAIGWLIWRQQYRLLLFLLAWMLLMLGPLLLLGTVSRSRYALPGCVPMMIAVGYMIADIVSVFGERGGRPRWLGMAIGVGLVLALWMPVTQVFDQVFAPYRVFATPAENYEYRTGWTAGEATQRAIATLQRAKVPNGVLITTNGWGPTDAFWVYMDRNVAPAPLSGRVHGQKVGADELPADSFKAGRLYYVDDFLNQPILRPAAEANCYLLKTDKWLYTPEAPVPIVPFYPVYFVCPVPVHTAHGDVDPEPILRRLNRIDGPPVRFDNPPNADGTVEGVAIFVLKPPVENGEAR